MINPDYSNIQSDSTKAPKDVAKMSERPVGAPQTKKDFKVLMRKDHDTDEEEESTEGGLKSQGDKGDVKSVTKVAKPDAPKSNKTSIFSLSESAGKKSASASTAAAPAPASSVADEETPEVMPMNAEQVKEGITPEQMPDKPQTAVVHPLLKPEQPKAAIATPNAAPAEKKAATPMETPTLAKGKKTPMKEGGGETVSGTEFSSRKEDLANLTDQGASGNEEEDFTGKEQTTVMPDAQVKKTAVPKKDEKVKDTGQIAAANPELVKAPTQGQTTTTSKKAPAKEGGGAASVEAVPFNQRKKEIGSSTDQGSSGKKDENAPAINLAAVKPEPLGHTTAAKSSQTQERTPLPEEPKSIFTPNAFTSPKERPVNPKFSQEQPDLTYVNPMHVGLQVSTSAPREAPAARPPLHTDILKLIDQMVDKISTIKTEGKTDTVITIKNLPLFDGANLKITSFDSAKREFNVAFENLKPEAQKLLLQNMDAFKTDMQTKGFTVHIATATTVDNTPVYLADAQTGRERHEGEREQQRRQQQQEEEQE